ncbi:cytochrome C oxidase subunit isoform X3 [Tasmannia lanceolata]|uniref:cytochrome C oxidase subunit isoform X3 n=1 Tax=Tasmannia lanceolata TaxID=3420 RepID=UPI004062E554
MFRMRSENFVFHALEIEKMKVENLRNGDVEKRVKKKEQSTISGIDFVGLDFSDKKKSRGLPPGLVPVSDPFPEGDLPEVEFIVGDTSKFEGAMSSRPSIKLGEEDDGSGLYKPKVSTWGVFPRPSNISEAFGGGRTISPGEVLETAEDKAAREARTRQLVAAYKNKMGLTIDAKTKSDCEKALKDGDYLMDLGNLRDALPYYEKVMKELVFQSELHGLAALQWSICQDSLSRPNEARGMYERLQSHPNVQVSKRARQFVFSFQAMEMMKVTSSSFSQKTTGYQDYFQAFVKDEANYTLTKEEEDEGALIQALPYIMFLVSPIFLVLFIALRK